ncbi:aminoglycoside phosphotransferase family protein [Sporichthya sp.]|uniref:phosphotransferase family protein n=1 Tax=Sporichthya sp. TaxID=65475 RepID=UPI001798C2CD|nr:aminoglycoside phosphotransferase family protein [Sporichthya sp.]MBA3742679.1 phosphotransferase [Sporichthya sp.]
MVASAVELPGAVAPAAVDADWLTAVLHSCGVLGRGVRVEQASGEAIGHGLLCESVRFHLTYSESTAAPATVVGKFSAQHPRLRAGAIAEEVYQREFAFYAELSTGLAVPTPRCLALVGDPEVEFVLVLEDLAPTEPVDQVEGCSLKQAEAVIDAAVGLHAPRWGAVENAEWSVRDRWLPRIAEAYLKSFEAFVRELGPTAEEADIGERLAPVLGQWFAGQPRPWTVTHGDFRLDNMLFGIRGGREPVGILDWQTLLPSSGTADIAYFIGSSFEPDVRRTHEERLLRRYHAGLVAAGVGDYPYEQCLRDYRYNCFLGYMMPTYSAALVKRTERGDAMFSTWVRRVSAQIHDLDCLALLPRGI